MNQYHTEGTEEERKVDKSTIEGEKGNLLTSEDLEKIEQMVDINVFNYLLILIGNQRLPQSSFQLHWEIPSILSIPIQR